MALLGPKSSARLEAAVARLRHEFPEIDWDIVTSITGETVYIHPKFDNPEE